MALGYGCTSPVILSSVSAQCELRTFSIFAFSVFVIFLCFFMYMFLILWALVYARLFLGYCLVSSSALGSLGMARLSCPPSGSGGGWGAPSAFWGGADCEVLLVALCRCRTRVVMLISVLSTFPLSPAFSLPCACLTLPWVLPDLGQWHSIVADGLPILICLPFWVEGRAPGPI